jgi:hypothetical protein
MASASDCSGSSATARPRSRAPRRCSRSCQTCISHAPGVARCTLCMTGMSNVHLAAARMPRCTFYMQ